jgi:acyl carrier protein
MLKSEFFQLLAEAIEAKDVSLDESTVIKQIPDYDSMAVLAIIAFVDEQFSKRLTAKQLNEIGTVRSLMNLIGMDQFTED